MTEADKRVSELLDRWIASLELHTRYLKLDGAEYAKVQTWPKHQRPNKWIIDLAKQRVGELRRHLQERKEVADDDFADALELMGFLTSLLASEHLERFIPQALPQKDATVRQGTLKSDPQTETTATVRAPRATTPAKQPAARPSPRGSTSRPVAARPATPAARRATAPAGAQKGPAARPAAPRPAARTPAKLSEQATRLVIADAVRLLDWGNEWPALAGLIARLADRPAEKEIWGVLSEHRATIEARAKPRKD